MALWPFSKADVELGNVDNTSDAAKPVSTAQQTALDGKVSVGTPLAFPHALLGGGEEIYPRDSLTSATVSTPTQNLRLVYFTARKSFPTTQVRVIGGTAVAAATPTLIENGLFEIDGAGDGTRVAVTGNDTSLYSVANSTYTRLWLASHNIVIGQRYALSWLVVTSVTAPNHTGMVFVTSANAEVAISARLVGTIAGQTATPASFTAASVLSINMRPYGVILP